MPFACAFSLLTFVALNYAEGVFLKGSGGDRFKHEHSLDQAVPDFEQFVSAHGRSYPKGSKEYEQRKIIYEERAAEIRRHNADPERLWTAGVNRMSDFLDSEFRTRLGWRHTTSSDRKGTSEGGSGGSLFASSLLELSSEIRKPLPTELDWMNLSMASKVPDQGGCGSCWAVASANLLSAHFEITHGRARDFSVQELVSCTQNPLRCGGTGGCEGATVELALDWAVYNGLGTEGEIPYAAEKGKCDHRPFRKDAKDQGKLDQDGRLLEFVKMPAPPGSSLSTSGMLGGQSLGLKSFRTLETNKYEPLVRALVEQGPVAVTVAASDWSMYSKGIFDQCKDPTLNHAVLLMGMGQVRGRKTWLVRNSWGESWGEGGYIKLLRTDNEEKNCAVDKSPQDGVACLKGPKQVTVCGTCGILYDSVVPTFGKIPSSLLEGTSAIIDGDW
jgi:cathepsin L